MASSKKQDEDSNHAAAWRSTFLWIADALMLPCKPIIFPLFSPRPPAVTGTILHPPDDDANRRLRLFLQDGSPAGPTLLLLDLPLAPCQLAGAARITFECESGGAGPLLAEPAWAVSCDGRRAGFGTRRAAPTEAEARALESMRAVSAGAGRGVGGFTYMRGRFDRVVGSADSESYHLVGPAGFLGAHELSFFFLRVRH
ncbi:protein MIZU-KUSSEI 1-like [Phoenix dactylifera]|uniref:Protein MIZU-KUSSEI 1-like n=1 Tax=Phoenix dactylifera TaxID=42345 RepID=A0A8B7C2K5_PHODC|nr:protein MIZU-KUSSEI 1-like [Phoenix dactylifera]